MSDKEARKDGDAEVGQEWTVDKLIQTAQAFDRAAHRDGGLPYSSNRRLAFTARKFARSKLHD